MTLLRLMPLLLALAACSPSGPDTAAAPPLAGAKIGGPFRLTGGDGAPVTDRSLGKRWRVMYFGYTFCPDVCPTDMQAIGAGLRLLEARDPAKARAIVPVFVTIDPARDTAPVVKRFAAAFHPRAIGLTGSEAAIAAMAKSYGVYAEKGEASPGGGYLVNHARTTYLMDPNNLPIALIPADEGPEAVANALERWVR
ncbi:SCO family protein [Sphingomonas sp. GM_Shp_2]|uniref:SCO family protein n=1 Tax=Sphingomonas sp. GM_Shp_2 TaxID=2937380 RepID=UPI00226ADB65|nr:SCO family protein [Sphingomonas sp. GM_Shp_2]